jgi:hypothetical protein
MLRSLSIEVAKANFAFQPMTDAIANAAKVRIPPILWKNSVLQAQKAGLQTKRERLSHQALLICCGAGKILASLRRFWGGSSEQEFVICTARST